MSEVIRHWFLSLLIPLLAACICVADRAGSSDDLYSAVFSHRPAIAQALLPTHSEQLPESSSGAAVASLERALSEGNAEKAHDLLIQILKRPHLGSDLLLRLGMQFADQELYGEAAEAYKRGIK